MAGHDLENGGRTTDIARNNDAQIQNTVPEAAEKQRWNGGFFQQGWEFVRGSLRECKFEKPRQPRLRAIGGHGIVFICIQISFRFVSAMVSLGAVAFIGYLYNYWRGDATARVDVLFPSFFPLLVGFFLDLFEIFTLLWMKSRKHAINPVAVGLDVALIGTGIFCFLIINMVDNDPGKVFERPDSRHGYWAFDMRNAMIFMIAFSLIHATFILVAAAGVVHAWISGEKSRKNKRLARIQAEMVRFTERNTQSQNVTVAPASGSALAPVSTIPEPPRAVFR